MKQLLLILLLFVGFTANIWSQTQTIRGKIIDDQAEFPVTGATIVLMNSENETASFSDIDGYFELNEVPVGRQMIEVNYVGYKRLTIPNILVTAGKESVLEIRLVESVEKLDEVVITLDTDKELPQNEFAKVSAKPFSLEEVTRYSGGRNDPARLVASFAGVSAPNDSRNDIVVRGNSPTGLLWRIEGIPIQTTNHFYTLGTTGGPVNALNTNLLSTSDFLTSAFPAEYGNANAAVFDINFRSGNPENHEFTAQLAAFSGAELMAEGPINKANNSSYLAAFRYGVASIAATGTQASPEFQDAAFKLDFGKSKLGNFQLFGLWGGSNIDFLGDEIDEDDLFADPDEDSFVESAIAMAGISNTYRFGKSAFLKTTLGGSFTRNDFAQDEAIENSSEKYRAVNVDNIENRFTISSVLTKKFNSKLNTRLGLLNETYDIDIFAEDRDDRVQIPDSNNDGIPDFFITQRNIDDTYNLTQGFAQAEYRFNDDVSLNAGLHSQFLSYTEDLAIEPRLSFEWFANNTTRFSAGYGFHAQTIPAPIFFFESESSPGSGITERTNDDLDFSKSHHFVLAMNKNLGGTWRLKTEAYYQSLFDVPVEQTPSSYSILNQGADFVFDEEGNLVNEGVGTNYGLEITLEKFFSDGFYLLATNSLFDSTYEGSDGIERNTAFNNNWVSNVLAGREWAWGKSKQNAWTIDTKITASGGAPFTPIDLEGTRANAGREVRFDDIAFSERYDTYFRLDLKIGTRLNSANKKRSHQFFLDLQNVTNRENEFVRRYNEVTDEINVVDQIGFFPDVLYRFQF
ncbi:MAG: TonB-dependent receptor [Saprospiraceae bacterium]|nr:TonB-dependent receptor [Saprospiraceae bacterium]